MKIVTYLTFNGNCREAMTFYKACLGGDLSLITIGDMPHASPTGVPDALKDNIMHASLSIGSAMLMATDAVPGLAYNQGTNVAVSVLPDSVEEIERLWAAFSKGATITHNLADAPWGARYGALTDKFGVHWMFNYEYPK
jgi:PhnB protein